jgi:bacterioferritin
MPAAGSFTTEITAIRKRARQKMEEGPVTSSYGKKPEDVISVLNEVVATEIVCWMRYTRHAISATGINRAQVASEFTDPTTRRLLEDILADEEEHADDLVDLLGG